MSALVLTILICVAWAAMVALGYLRGGWREVVTLAAILLAYAVASEWAAPNGRDLAAVFGGNTYRSTTTIGLAYLFGGVALFGYFGGTRLPRPIPLSATERFIGGAVGLLNGGVLAALALRIVRSSAFGPGDGTVLQEATLARLLISQAGYLLLIGLIGAILTPFLSLLFVRQLPYAAEYKYVDDAMPQQSPAFGYFPNHRDEMAHTASPQPQSQPQPSMYTAPYALQAQAQAAPGVPAQFVPAFAPDPAFAPPGTVTTLTPAVAAAAAAREAENAPASLMPATPMLPRAVPVPMWPTPSLPVTAPTPAIAAIAPTMTAPGTSNQEAQALATETPPDASGNASAQSSRPTGPPGFAITASQPLPPSVMASDAPAATPAATSLKPLAPASAPTLPASTTGPTPFTATTTRVAGEPPMARGNETNAANPNAVFAPAPLPVADTAMRTDVGAEREVRLAEAAAPPTPPARPIVPTPLSDLIPAAPLLPRVPEMPASTNLTPFLAQQTAPAAPVTGASDTTAPSATPVRISRARVATARAPEPQSSSTPSGTGQSAATNGPMPTPTANPPPPRPAQPGPNMHPCPVCEYPVRNGARFCPNCGSAQSRT